MSVSRHSYHMAKPPQLSSEEYHPKGCCAYSAANLSMRYFVPPEHMQDSLKTSNVKGLEGSDVVTVRCPFLTCIEQCRGANSVVNGHLGACGKVMVRKNSLGHLPKEANARLARC